MAQGEDDQLRRLAAEILRDMHPPPPWMIDQQIQLNTLTTLMMDAERQKRENNAPRCR